MPLRQRQEVQTLPRGEHLGRLSGLSRILGPGVKGDWMKLFAVQDVIDALVDNYGFHIGLTPQNIIILLRHDDTDKPLVFRLGEDLHEFDLRKLLSKFDLGIDNLINSLPGHERSGYIYSEVDTSTLPKEEIASLARESGGMWADHADIKDSVEWVRSLREGMYREGIEE